MPKTSDILGMNARSFFTRLNSSFAQSLAGSKYATKVVLQENNIPTAEILGVLGTNEDVALFDWEQLDKNFVIKPSNGSAGKGIVIFKKKLEDKLIWVDVVGQHWSVDDIKLHCSDILEGQYSTHGLSHSVIIEQRVLTHPALKKFVPLGTPDIRVIVYHSVPVMAMLRLPTRQSEGRANIHQGAICVGIDLATGITTYAISSYDPDVRYLPGTKQKLSGIKIPFWNQVLECAVEAAKVANLEYSGIDLFIDEARGPLVVELNAQPGLAIQIANRAGLRRRLERVRDLEVINTAHGVRIGQALFAQNIADKVRAESGVQILSPREPTLIWDKAKKEKREVMALINTGRFRSAIATDLAKELGLLDSPDLLWFQTESKEGTAPVIEVTFKLRGIKKTTAMIVSARLNSKPYQLNLGRHDLEGFVVGMERP